MRIAITGLMLCMTLTGFAQSDWQLQKDHNGVKVYTTTNPNSSAKMVRVEVTLKQPVERVATEIMNVAQYKDWIYGCIESTLLARPNDSSLIYRHVTDAPWPFEDRDQVSLFVSVRNPKTGSVTITSRLLPNYPKVPNYTRIQQSNASWMITPVKGGSTVIYNLSFDPGGNVPGWLINLFIDEGPYQSFLNLQKRLEP